MTPYRFSLVVDEPVLDAGLGRRSADVYTLLLAGRSVTHGFDSRGRLDDVLKILLLTGCGAKRWQSLAVQEFRRHINMGYDKLGELLEKLARQGYIYSGRQGWVLKTEADSIELNNSSSSSFTVRCLWKGSCKTSCRCGSDTVFADFGHDDGEFEE